MLRRIILITLIAVMAFSISGVSAQETPSICLQQPVNLLQQLHHFLACNPSEAPQPQTTSIDQPMNRMWRLIEQMIDSLVWSKDDMVLGEVEMPHAR